MTAQNDLIRLLEQYGLTLPRNAIEWRTCRNADGAVGVSGHHVLHGLVTELLTDGIVSWFLLGDHETLFFGHKANFEVAKEEKEREPKAPARKKPFNAKTLALLNED